MQGVATTTASSPVKKAAFFLAPTRARASERFPNTRHPRADLEHAEQVQTDGHHQQRQRQVHGWGLQLETPTHLVAGGAQAQPQGADSREGRKDASGVQEPALPRRALIALGAVDQAERLHAEDGEHARHEVQHNATQQREQERVGERQAAGRRCSAGGSEAALRGACARAGHQGREIVSGLHLEPNGVLLAATIGERQHGVERFLARTRPGVHREHHATRRVGHLLPTVPNEVLAGHEQAGVAHSADATRQRVRRRNRHAHFLAGVLETGRPIHRSRQLRTRRGESLAARRHRVARTHRQRHGDIRLLGHAQLVVAHHPKRPRRQPRRPTRRQAGHGDVREQQDRLLKTVGDQIAERYDVRRGELRFSGGKAFRQRPAQRCRQTGIAGIHPIGVPTGIRFEMQAERDHATVRWQACLFGDELHLGVFGGHRLGGGLDETEAQGQRPKRGFSLAVLHSHLRLPSLRLPGCTGAGRDQPPYAPVAFRGGPQTLY